MTNVEQTEQPYRTANDTLMQAMEMFSESEPKGVLIIHNNEGGNIIVTANTGKCLALGMIETVKYMILRGEI
jgi:hypothetical protein